MPKWNLRDGSVNRVSYSGSYRIENGYPLNPHGRTGIVGRGLLGRWAVNHAADALVTRWSRDPDGRIKTDTNTGRFASRSSISFMCDLIIDIFFPFLRNILQMVAIQRRDNHMWAMPGGMLDANETPQTAAKREFQEEALNGASGDFFSP